MKAMVCEMCNGQDLVKQDGMYVCQSCGTKYTVEEAKKLLVEGTVKIDKTDDVEKLLVLARRAREDDNSENAEKYYEMVLREDPNNWEAAFFQVYYKAMQCKVADISSAAMSVANCIGSTLDLIAEIENKEERDKATTLVVTHSILISTLLASGAQNHFSQFPLVKGQAKAFEGRISSIRRIYSQLELAFTTTHKDTEQLLTVLKAEKSFVKTFMFGMGKSFAPETKRLEEEIKKLDPSYEETKPEKKGCYVATAVYGSYDCPQVWTLRRYRDNTLAKKWYGLLFIYLYYTISPTLVRWFGKKEWFKNMWKPKLDRMVKRLNDDGVEDTPYNDKRW